MRPTSKGILRRAQISLLVIAAAALAYGCKVRRSYSAAQSLTADELQKCSFEGRRFAVIVAPDFEGDVTAIQDLFVKFHSESQFFQKSAIISNPKLRDNKQCRDYFESEASKYEEFVVLQGRNATFGTFKDKLAALKRRIAMEYRAPLKRQGKPQGQVQIVTIFTGHGTNHDLSYPDGSLLFSGTSPATVPMKDVMQALYDNLFTKCGFDCKEPEEQIADEILTLIDSCYSGIFGVTAKQFLASRSYDLAIKPDSDSRATRFLAYSAADSGQVATGGLQPTGRGTLFQMLEEVVSYFTADIAPIGNEDGKISFAETWKYIADTSYMRFAPRSASAWRGLASTGICLNEVTRRSFLDRMKSSSTFFERAFADPVNNIFNDNNGAGSSDRVAVSPASSGGMQPPSPISLVIQRPTAFTNLSDALLQQTIFAVRDEKAEINAHAKEMIAAHTSPTAKAKVQQEITIQVKLVQQTAAYWKANTDLTAEIDAKTFSTDPVVLEALADVLKDCNKSGSGAGSGGALPTSSSGSIPPSGGSGPLLGPDETL